LSKLARYFLVRMLLVLLVLTSVTQAEANERVLYEYQYNDIGNNVSRRQHVSDAALSADAVTAPTGRQIQTLSITLAGDGLLGARLGNQNTYLTFSDIDSSNDQLQFTVEVDEGAGQGPAQISLLTGLDTVFFSLNVPVNCPACGCSQPQNSRSDVPASLKNYG